MSRCAHCPGDFRPSSLWHLAIDGEVVDLCDPCHDSWIEQDAHSGNPTRPHGNVAPVPGHRRNHRPIGGTPAGPLLPFEWGP